MMAAHDMHRLGVFRRGRRASRLGQCARSRDPRARQALAGAAREPVRGARPAGELSQVHGHAPRRPLQPAPGARLDAELSPGAQAAAGRHPPRASAARAPSAAALAAHRARHGRLGGAQLQPRALRQPDLGAARRTLRHHPHRSGRLPTAFLDRARPGAALHLRHTESRRTSVRHGLRQSKCMRLQE